MIWGKGKDYKYNSTLQLNDESAQPKLELIGKDNVDHEVITISKQGEQRRTVVETV